MTCNDCNGATFAAKTKKHMRFIVITTLSLAFAGLFACRENNSAASAPAASAAKPQAGASDTAAVLLKNEEFYKLLQTDSSVYLVNVSTPLEFKRGFIAHSLNIDYQANDFERQIRGLDRRRPVALYCPTGIRSGEAGKKLKQMGFAKVYVLEYGLRSWRWPLVITISTKPSQPAAPEKKK